MSDTDGEGHAPDGHRALGRHATDGLAATVEDAIDGAVEQRVSGVLAAAQDAAVEAGESAERAEEAAGDAAQSRADAGRAGRAAVEAAHAIAPDDPVVDTALRELEAGVDEQNPFGVLGRPISHRSPFRIGFTAALGVAVAYGLVQALSAVRSVLLLVLVSAFLAIGLDPAVRFLERRGLLRGRAVGVVLLLVVACFVGFGAAVVPPIVDQGQEFVDAVPGYLRDLQDNARVAELDARYGVLDNAEQLLSDPERVGTTVFGGVVGVGKVVVGLLFSTLAVLILTLYFLANLPAIRANAYRLVPRSRRARVALLSDEILTRVGGYVAGALSIAGIAGLSSFVLLLALGVPYPVPLSLLVTITGLVPLVGATIGASVVALVAFSESVQAGIVVVVFFLAYQQLENYVLYPRIMKRSVDVSPAATVVAVLMGGSLLGVVGALLAIPIAAGVQLVLQEVVAPRQDDA